jgi:hypothetical protein
MRTLLPDLDVEAVSRELLEFWRERSLPPSGDPPVAAGAASFFQDPVPSSGGLPRRALERLVVADVAARYLRLKGRPVRDLLFVPEGAPAPEIDAELDQYAIWFGRNRRRPLAAAGPGGAVGPAVEAMAAGGYLRATSGHFLACPSCGEIQGPETTGYRTEARTIQVLRVALRDKEPPVSALVWTDAAWKLLGTEAVLLHPDRPYVRAEFSRRGRSEEILVARSALDRIALWLPNAQLKVLEERPGSQWAGTRYDPPLGASAPERMGPDAAPGELVARRELEDEGTGLVPLVPAHGPVDAEIARELGRHGESVVRIDGRLEDRPRTKYSGLPLDTAEACIVRDLRDADRQFLELRVRRGVPRCGSCGNELYWRAARAWCLVPSAVPEALRTRFSRLLPGERWPDLRPGQAWPVTGVGATSGTTASLAECGACGRLTAPPGPERCACGAGRPTMVGRPLLPVLANSLAVATGLLPFPPGASLWFVAPERRRVPWLVHRLLALEAVGGRPAELHATVLAAGPPEGSSEGLALPPPADAIRAALLRQVARCPPGQSLSEAIVQESHRLRRLWRRASELLAQMVSDGFLPDGLPITGRLEELLPEDRAFLGAFEAMRREVLGHYERGEWAEGYDRLAEFLDGTFRYDYVPLVAGRTALPAGSPGRLALDRLLGHVLPRICELAGPVTPQVAESVHRALLGDGASLFAGTLSPLLEPLLDDGAAARLAEWGEVTRAVLSGRRRLGWPLRARLPSLVLLPRSEEEGARLAAAAPMIARAVGAEKVLVHPPSQPWPGRRIEARPNEEAIRRAFPVYHRRIVSVLAQMDGRRLLENSRSDTLAVAVEGQPALRIAPALLDVVESLPEGYSPVAWRRGEMYLERRNDLPPPSATGPGLSLPLQRVRRHLGRRLERLPPGGARPSKAFVWAEGAFAAELAQALGPLGQGLEPTAVLLAPSTSLFVPSETTVGRARRGVYFQAWLPGCRVPRAGAKRRRRRRVESPLQIAAPQSWDLPAEVDLLAEPEVARSQALSAWTEELGARGTLAVLGPAKLSAAWDRGIRSTGAFLQVPFGTLAAVPGFGPVVAERVLRELAPERPLPPLAPFFEPASLGGGIPDLEPGSPEPVGPSEPADLPPAGTMTFPAATAPAVAPAASVPPPFARRAPPTPPAAPAPPPPIDPSPPPPAPVAAGRLVVLTGTSREAAWETFQRSLSERRPGLWIGRFAPPPLEDDRRASLEQLWLSGAERPNAVRPADLPGLLARVRGAVEEGGMRSVLLEEVEYLAALNGGAAVADFLGRLSDLAKEHDVRIWAPVDLALFAGDPAQLAAYSG